MISAVILSLQQQVTLDPAFNPRDLLTLFVEAGPLEGDNCQICSLSYVDGLQEEGGEPVQVAIRYGDELQVPELRTKEIEICRPPVCFEPSRTGSWEYNRFGAAFGAARSNRGGFQVCGQGAGYHLPSPRGGTRDNLSLLFKRVQGEHDFVFNATISEIGGNGYGGIEIRDDSFRGNNAGGAVVAFGAMRDGKRFLLVPYTRGIPEVELPDFVRLDEFPIHLRIERSGGSLKGFFAVGNRGFDEYFNFRTGGRLGASVTAGLVQASRGAATANSRVLASDVTFVNPELEVDLPPPPPRARTVRPTPGPAPAPGRGSSLEFTGVGIEELVSVNIAGIEADISSKEAGRVVVNIPETNRPVRGDITIRGRESSSVIRNAFFSYGDCEPTGPPGCEGGFIRGDANGDEALDISDALYILGWLFLGDADPTCLESADANDDKEINITDPSYLLAYLFVGGAEPPAPFPERGFADGDASDCDLAEHLPVITNITVLNPAEGGGAGGRSLDLREGSRLQIDGSNLISENGRDVVVAGDASLEIIEASSSRLLVDVLRVPSSREVEVGIIRDFAFLSEQVDCFPTICPPTMIGPIVTFPQAVQLIPSARALALLGSTIRNENSRGLVLQLDPERFNRSSDISGLEVNIEASLQLPVVSGVSPGARRVSITERFQGSGVNKGADAVRRVADSLRESLAAGGSLREVVIIPDVTRSRVLIEPTSAISEAQPQLDGDISIYGPPIGLCGPEDYHPIDDERAFGWCRFQELIEPCGDLPAFEWFFTKSDVFTYDDVLNPSQPGDRSPKTKHTLYNLEAFCHIREHRLWCRDDLDQLIADAETEIPPFPRDAWICKTVFISEEEMDVAAASQDIDPEEFKDRFYSYYYTGKDESPGSEEFEAGNYYLIGIHHTTKDINDWFWYDAYVNVSNDVGLPDGEFTAFGIGGCGGSNTDAPDAIKNSSVWSDYFLCTNVTDQQPVVPGQGAAPDAETVGPTATSNSAWCGNFFAEDECPDVFDGGESDSTTNNDGGKGLNQFTGYDTDTCMNCHRRSKHSNSSGEQLDLDFAWSLKLSSLANCEPVEEVSFSENIEGILNGCGCHGGGDDKPPGSMTLTTTAYDSIVEVAAVQVPGMALIEPGSPEQSYLWLKLIGAQDSVCGDGDDCGSSMPLGGGLQPHQLDLIEIWILGGALDN
ncbi:MAG: dockerin type I repeat-containing protein [Planctomycetota bacterium]|nr:dockerin type I repeat-containing protein [Planctomycetota bacterium]